MELTEPQRLDIKWAIDSLSNRVEQYKLYDDYYIGEQKSLALASAEYKGNISFVDGFCENLCGTVVDVLKDRLKLTDFTHDQEITEIQGEAGETIKIDPLAEIIGEIWRQNRMDELQGEIYLETLKSGDGYAFVWPDEDGQPMIDPNQAFLVTVLYSEKKRGVIDRAAKAWKGQDDYGRLNLYYPDRIEKYQTISKQKFGDEMILRPDAYRPSDDEPVLLNPYGQVPVFHFRNNAGVGKFGVSEIRSAIPSQDRLNKTIIDGLVIGEEHSLPVRYALGFEFPKDPRTQEPLMNWKAGDWWLSRQKDGVVGQLPAADLVQFVTVATDARAAIARVTRTPLHYFQQQTGTPPSGESLKTEEAPLTAKVSDRQTSFGNVWEDVFLFALKIRGIEEARLEAVWANTEPRDDTAEILNQVSKVEKLGFSKKQALRELEYSDAEIAKIEAEKTVEPVAAQPGAPGQQPTNGNGKTMNIAYRLRDVQGMSPDTMVQVSMNKPN